MKIHQGLIAAAVVLGLALSPAAAATFYVDDDCTPPGSGSQADPYCAIQDAYDDLALVADDEIRVMPGTYNECPEVWGARFGLDPLPVRLIADAWVNGGNRTTTIIDGTGVCDIGGLPTVRIGGNGAVLEGFTIRGGGDSGVFAFGGVAITNNVISNNVGAFGGGIYFYGASCYYGDGTATIADNLIQSNAAEFDAGRGFGGDGGGVYVFAVGADEDAGTGCANTGDPVITLDSNTIDLNTADNAFGAGMVVFTNSTEGRSVSVAVTQNLITTNTMELGATGYGGGIWASTYGYGSETIEIRGNTLDANRSEGDGGGMSTWVNAFAVADHAMIVDDNTVSGNDCNGNGGGIDAFMIVSELESDQATTMQITNNRITTNDSEGTLGGGGGLLATLQATRSAAPGMAFNVVGNLIQGNSANFSGGGVSVLSTADADPDTDPPAPATAEVNFFHNTVVENTSTDSGTAIAGGVFVFLQAFGEATSEVNWDLSNVSANLTEDEGGGFHVESFTGYQDADPLLPEGIGSLNIAGTIIANNEGFGIGGPFPGDPGFLTPGGTGNLQFSISGSDLFNSEDGEVDPWIPDPIGSNGNFSADPGFNAAFVTSLCGRIGPADPSRAPDANGDAFVDGIDIVRVATAFGSGPEADRYDASADRDGNGMVDGNDLAIVASNFATTCP